MNEKLISINSSVLAFGNRLARGVGAKVTPIPKINKLEISNKEKKG